jgi:hypothetical protein
MESAQSKPPIRISIARRELRQRLSKPGRQGDRHTTAEQVGHSSESDPTSSLFALHRFVGHAVCPFFGQMVHLCKSFQGTLHRSSIQPSEATYIIGVLYITTAGSDPPKSDLMISLTPQDCQTNYELDYETIHSFAVAGVIVKDVLKRFVAALFLGADHGMCHTGCDPRSKSRLRYLLPLSDIGSTA